MTKRRASEVYWCPMADDPRNGCGKALSPDGHTRCPVHPGYTWEDAKLHELERLTGVQRAR